MLETGTKSVTGLKPRFLNSDTEIAVPLENSASVYPSAGADSTARAALMPPAPAMFSMTKRWPSFSPSLSVTSRAVTSATPPAPNGRISRIGLFGYLCASAICGSNNAAASAAIPANDAPCRLIVYRLSAIARAPSKLEQPRRIVDQYLLLQFGLRRKQRNQVDQIAVVGHHLHVGVRPVGPP